MEPNKMIAVVDLGFGNLKSIVNALELFGENVVITNKKEVLMEAEKIVLPGVGSFGEGIKSLHNLQLFDVLREEVLEKKKKFLGICLGMQLLASKGYEEGENEGLNFFPGEVKKLDIDKKFKIPHMGWDNITIKKECPILAGIKGNLDFYFVHSYHFVPETDENVAAVCNYGIDIVSALYKDNIFATQFHPEKSQQKGLEIIERFIEQ